MKCADLIPELIHAVGKVLYEEGEEFRLRHAELTDAYIAIIAEGAEERGRAIEEEIARMQNEGGNAEGIPNAAESVNLAK